MTSAPTRSAGDQPQGTIRFGLWGTSASISVDPPQLLDTASRMLFSEIEAVDGACNRFRPESELTKLNDSHGRKVRVSQLLFDAIEAALRVAALTDGAVDPTIGSALVALGYDDDYDQISARDSATQLKAIPLPAPGWQSVMVERRQRSVRLPRGTLLDLGATAKAWCVDRCVQRIVAATGASVLVSIGGDLAVAGPPPSSGWSIAVVPDTRRDDQAAQQVISIRDGGMASSSTTGRTWKRNGQRLHHIIDPRSGWPAQPVWRMVTVAAASCLDANAASTASVVWGESARPRLQLLGLPARLVHHDQRIFNIAGWPEGAPEETPPVAQSIDPSQGTGLESR